MTQITEKLIQINKEIGIIGKSQKNQQQGFSFRGIDQVMNELHALFAKHEVVILPQVKSRTREERTNTKGTLLFYTHLTVEFQFMAVDGSLICSTIIGEAMDSGDKGCNKAMSVALKYALLQMFLIPTEELKDPDAETHEVKAAVLSDIGFAKALKRIAEGEHGLVTKIESAYNLTTEQRTAIDRVINDI